MSHQCLNKTRGFESSHVILVRIHQHLKMIKKIVCSQLKFRGKSHAMGRKKKHWNSTNKGKDHLNLWELFVCLFVGEPINGKFINGEREREREKEGKGEREKERERERKKERGTKSVLLKPKLLSKIKVQILDQCSRLKSFFFYFKVSILFLTPKWNIFPLLDIRFPI